MALHNESCDTFLLLLPSREQAAAVPGCARPAATRQVRAAVMFHVITACRR